MRSRPLTDLLREANVSFVSVFGTAPLDRAWTGALNMAADEWLLERAVHEGQASLRFYTWAAPTISLGHFQASGQPEPNPDRFAGLDWVRRLSGGGAILHHHELTYSCVVPVGHPFSHEPRSLYGAVHAILIDVLRDAGVDARLRGQTESEREGSFLCFSRGDAQDIVVGSDKIVGSAQRRRKGAVLQHGSLLWERSPHAPEFRGICDLGASAARPEAIVEELTVRLGKLLSGPEGRWTPATFGDEERRELETLAPKYVLENGAVGK
jgi:lipoyl(octanoyl) transferase